MSNPNLPWREQTDYKTRRTFWRQEFADVDREEIPNYMWKMADSPSLTRMASSSLAYDEKFVDWLAQYDALLDRAKALGYIVGQVGNKRRENSHLDFYYWYCEAVFNDHNFYYPINRSIDTGRWPRFDDVVLMTRGYHEESEYVPTKRFVPIPPWFLTDPTL